MIDEKKLIEDLIPILNENDDMFLAGRIIGTIDRQPQVGGWIPVSERLPKEYETVIGVTDLNYYCIAVYCKQHGFRSMDVGVESDIIAWQPLPEPYKESEEE